MATVLLAASLIALFPGTTKRHEVAGESVAAVIDGLEQRGADGVDHLQANDIAAAARLLARGPMAVIADSRSRAGSRSPSVTPTAPPTTSPATS